MAIGVPPRKPQSEVIKAVLKVHYKAAWVIIVEKEKTQPMHWKLKDSWGSVVGVEEKKKPQHPLNFSKIMFNPI